MQIKTKNLISTLINGFIFITTFICVLLLLIKTSGQYLGAQTFKFYTNLSNIFLGISCSIMLFFNIKSIIKKEIYVSKFATLAKYYAVITTTITFIVVITFLGPVISYKAMFSNFVLVMFHAVNPIIGLLSFLLLDNVTKIEFKHTVYAFIATATYTIFYGIYYGITHDDFYKFFANGPFILIVIMLLILGFNFGQASLYRYINNKRKS